MAIIEIIGSCGACHGMGTFTGTDANGNPVSVKCPNCGGDGLGEKSFGMSDSFLDDVKDKLNDIMDKCNDIKEVVDAL